jgi:hypothetical protein
MRNAQPIRLGTLSESEDALLKQMVWRVVRKQKLSAISRQLSAISQGR